MSLVSLTSLGQGVYYLFTGIWPLISESTFERVTGPKTDFWLVKTVGLLISVIGGVLVRAGWLGRVSSGIAWLAVGSAASLTGVDLVYVAKRRISPVYLLDALVELVLLAGWALGMRQRS